MELPHFTLYLRRFRSPVLEQGSGRLAWNAQTLRWLVSGAVWFAVALLYFAWTYGFNYQPDEQLTSTATTAVTTVAQVWIYLALASTAMQLSAEPSGLRRLAQRPDDPLWFASRLESRQAVLGIVCSALVQVLPVTLGSLWLLYTVASAEQGADWWPLLTHSLLAVARLPMLALAACALAVALRRSFFQPLLPVLLTVTAIGAALTNFTLQLAASTGNYMDQPGDVPGPWIPLLGGALLLTGARVMLRTLSRRDAGEGPKGALILLFCGVPLCSAVLVKLDEWARLAVSAGLHGDLYSACHAFYATYLPDLTVFRSMTDDPANPTLGCYGQAFPLAEGLLFALLCYAVSLAFWFFTAVQCLDAARGRGRARYNPRPPR